MNINSLNTTLFESTSARFRLSVNVMFNKQNTQTKASYPLIRISSNGNAKCDPSTFLVWTYTEGDFNTDISVYTSNPHLLRLRSMFEDIRQGILSERAFIQTGTGLVVSDEYSQPYSIANIGTKSNWISIRFVANALVDSTNNFIPAVEIALNNAPQSCILTVDEFLTLYTILNDISLPQMALTASIYALSELNSGQAAPNYNRQNNYNSGYQRQASGYQQGYQRQAAPNVGNTGFATRGQSAQPIQQEAVAPSYNSGSTFEPKRNTTSQQMQPRSSKPTMTNIEAIESIPTDDFSLDEEDSLADLFNN